MMAVQILTYLGELLIAPNKLGNIQKNQSL
jgi:hypothetical protein